MAVAPAAAAAGGLGAPAKWQQDVKAERQLAVRLLQVMVTCRVNAPELEGLSDREKVDRMHMTLGRMRELVALPGARSRCSLETITIAVGYMLGCGKTVAVVGRHIVRDPACAGRHAAPVKEVVARVKARSHLWQQNLDLVLEAEPARPGITLESDARATPDSIGLPPLRTHSSEPKYEPLMPLADGQPGPSSGAHDCSQPPPPPPPPPPLSSPPPTDVLRQPCPRRASD